MLINASEWTISVKTNRRSATQQHSPNATTPANRTRLQTDPPTPPRQTESRTPAQRPTQTRQTLGSGYVCLIDLQV